MPLLADYEAEYVQYPHSITMRAQSPLDLAKWIFSQYGQYPWDAIIGHSLGGLLALQLTGEFGMQAKKIVCLDTNFRPAGSFYRNLMTPAHMRTMGPDVLHMLEQERVFYTQEMLASLKESFDYTNLLLSVSQEVHVLYGDREQPEYQDRIRELFLPKKVLKKLHIRFVPHACHMLMLENPIETALAIREILPLP